jgi:hypothetical protein
LDEYLLNKEKSIVDLECHVNIIGQLYNKNIICSLMWHGLVVLDEPLLKKKRKFPFYIIDVTYFKFFVFLGGKAI